MGIKLAEIPYEVVATSEIDKYAIKAYEAIHGHNPNIGSITDVVGTDIPKEVDIMTYSFPCTDLSKAGKQKGLTNTRSGLVYEVLRILAELKDLDSLPKVLIMENVVDLVQSKFIKQFNEIQFELERLGYSNYTQKLNSKNYGIAQNRDRVFMVSILGEWNYNFPKEIELKHRLKDYLETNAEEKYDLSEKLKQFFISNSRKNEEKGNGFRFTPKNGNGVAKCITTNNGSIMDDNFILVNEATEIGYAVAYEGDSINLEHLNSKTRRGRVGKQLAQTLTTSCNQGVVEADRNAQYVKNRLDEFEKKNGYYPEMFNPYNKQEIKDVSPTVTTMSDRWQSSATVVINNNLRIRKLTPRETGRLMGMNDIQIDKQLSVTSNAQTYKQHGNGIVAQVIGLIIGMMWYEDETELRNIVLRNSHTWIKE